MLVALLVCLIPTTIGALLSAIGIAGMDRLVQHNVLAMSGRAVEAAGDCSTLLLDKTGTITLGNRQAAEFLPLPGVARGAAGRGGPAGQPGRRDARGRSIVVLAKQRFDLRERDARPRHPGALHRPDPHERCRPRRQRRPQGRGRRGPALGRPSRAGACPTGSTPLVEGVATGGGTPLVVAETTTGRPEVLGVVHLKDIVKEGIRQRFDQLRAMGIRTVMITGDNPLTAEAIADRGRRGRLPGRGHARGQDGPDPQGAGGRAAGRHDRRRHQRRARARPGRRRAWP